MAEQNEEQELEKKLLEEPWTGWKGILLKEKAGEDPKKEPAWTGWRGFVEKEKEGE